MSRTRVVGTVLLVVVIAASQLVATSTVEGGAPDVVLTFEPDPPVAFEPMTITATRSGCGPADEGSAIATLLQSVQDMVWVTTMASGEATADDEGRIEVTLEVPRAYPGDWFVTATCVQPADSLEASFVVPVPDSFALEVELSTLRRGEPFTIGLTGTGCVDGTARWELAVPPLASLGSGTVATADAGGVWSTTSSGVVPTDWRPDVVGLQVWCTFPDGVVVRYEVPTSVSTEVLPAVTDDNDDDGPAIDVGPRFTG